jgi:hemerythrin superfamily protein
MDAITLLKDDHKTVERLFKRFEKAGDRAHAEKRQVVDRIIAELAVHAAIEEQLFYPTTRAAVPETEDIALESLEEHHIVKWVLSELEGMSPDDERFTAKVTVLIENVRHHVEEEEQDYFPKVRKGLGRQALGELGEAMRAAKAVAPTHPHPRAPDTPPGNAVVGVAAGLVDRVGDAVSGAAQGGAAAVGDAISTVLGRGKPRVARKGSPAARKTAAKVRARGASGSQAVLDGVRDAKRAGRATSGAATRGAAQTRKAATAGAKATATSARGSAKRTRTVAKRAATTTGRTTRAAAKRTTAAARSSR